MYDELTCSDVGHSKYGGWKCQSVVPETLLVKNTNKGEGNTNKGEVSGLGMLCAFGQTLHGVAPRVGWWRQEAPWINKITLNEAIRVIITLVFTILRPF